MFNRLEELVWRALYLPVYIHILGGICMMSGGWFIAGIVIGRQRLVSGWYQ